MEQRIILVECLFPEGWQEVGPPLHPKDRHGSATALRDGKIVVVMFGWNDDLPGVWLDNRPSIEIGPYERAHVVNPDGVGERWQLADLRKGPYEMDGPEARWRWTLA